MKQGTGGRAVDIDDFGSLLKGAGSLAGGVGGATGNTIASVGTAAATFAKGIGEAVKAGRRPASEVVAIRAAQAQRMVLLARERTKRVAAKNRNRRISRGAPLRRIGGAR